MTVPRAVPARLRGAGLLDAPAERLIGYGRLLLCAVSLPAIYLDPTQPARFAAAAYAILAAYLAVAAGLALLAPGRRAAPRLALAIHGLDIAFIAALTFLTEGLASPFFAFFTFVLLAATFRWNWQGVLGTTGVLALIFLGTGLLEPWAAGRPDSADYDWNRAIIRGAYLFVASGMLAFFAAHRQRSRRRLARFARGPARPAPPGGHPALALLLAHAAAALEAPRILVAWEEREASGRHLALWEAGSVTTAREPPAASEGERMEELPPFSTVDIGSPGRRESGPAAAAIDPELVRRFDIRSIAGAGFEGAFCRGRVFALDRASWSEDHLALIEIVASRTGVELDRHALQRQGEALAAARERDRLARDLHDGVLQSLAAAGLQLQLAAREPDDKDRLEAVRQLLSREQKRIRAFVSGEAAEAGLEGEGEVEIAAALEGEAAELSRQWGCAVAVTVSPAGAAAPRRLVRELSHMLAEAASNAARHGKARHVDVSVASADRQLLIEINDDGTGFGKAAAGEETAPAQAPHAAPASLQARIGRNDGTISVENSGSGARLRIRLPLS
jgi:signal transduction histidine kinase